MFNDNVNRPSHYTQRSVECITIAQHLPFALGNAFKYIWRYEHKNNPIEDLSKALFYLEHFNNNRVNAPGWQDAARLMYVHAKSLEGTMDPLAHSALDNIANMRFNEAAACVKSLLNHRCELQQTFWSVW